MNREHMHDVQGNGLNLAGLFSTIFTKVLTDNKKTPHRPPSPIFLDISILPHLPSPIFSFWYTLNMCRVRRNVVLLANLFFLFRDPNMFARVNLTFHIHSTNIRHNPQAQIKTESPRSPQNIFLNICPRRGISPVFSQ